MVRQTIYHFILVEHDTGGWEALAYAFRLILQHIATGFTESFRLLCLFSQLDIMLREMGYHKRVYVPNTLSEKQREFAKWVCPHDIRRLVCCMEFQLITFEAENKPRLENQAVVCSG